MRWLLILALVGPAWAKKPKKQELVPVATPEAPAVPEETVELPCGYEPGAVHRYRYEKRSERTAPDRPKATQGETSTITLTVVSHDAAKTVLDVARSDQEMLSPPEDALMQRLLERVAEVSSGIPVRIEVDHATSQQRVVDTTELMKAYGSLADEMKAAIKQQTPDVPDEILAGIDVALANGALVEQSLADDLQPLFGFTCGKVPVGEVRYQTALANPLGASPLPASGTIRGVVGADTVDFSVGEELDPAKVVDQLAPLMEQMGVELPKDAGLDDLQVEIRTDLQVIVDRATGWPTRWSSEKTGSALGSGRTDTVVVTRLP